MVILRTNLREQATEVLRAQITCGELEPGVVYSATKLAGWLGVSATPVREALLDLAKDGLVVAVPNRGFRVVNPTEKELDELLELRLLLEVPPLSLVVEKASDEDLRQLHTPVDECAVAAANGDIAGFLRADRTFHLELLRHAGNAALCELVASLRDKARLTGLNSLAANGQLRDSAAEHRYILAAVQARDTEKAKSLLHDHLRHTRGSWAGQPEATAPEGSLVL